jgi:transposase-like protein
VVLEVTGNAWEIARLGTQKRLPLAAGADRGGGLQVEIPQAREAAEPFVSALFPHSTKLLRTRPLEAMVVGAFVRGLSMRDVESLCEEAGLGKLSKSTASRICSELRERFEAFKRRDL